jgi:hypothetical protein
MRKGFIEKVEAPLFDFIKLIPSDFGGAARLLEVIFGGLETRLDSVKPVDGPHIRIELLELAIQTCDLLLQLLLDVVFVRLETVS